MNLLIEIICYAYVLNAHIVGYHVQQNVKLAKNI